MITLIIFILNLAEGFLSSKYMFKKWWTTILFFKIFNCVKTRIKEKIINAKNKVRNIYDKISNFEIY